MPCKKCLGCAYILDYLPENRCPECGRTFDPDDPLTFTGGPASLGHGRSETTLLTSACIGSLLLLFHPVYVISSYTLGVDINSVLFLESPGYALWCCVAPVGFVILIIVALAVRRARRRGRCSRSLSAAGWIAAGSLAVVTLLMIFGSLINRW